MSDKDAASIAASIETILFRVIQKHEAGVRIGWRGQASLARALADELIKPENRELLGDAARSSLDRAVCDALEDEIKTNMYGGGEG